IDEPVDLLKVPVVERPELPGVPLGAVDEVSLLVTGRVAHRRFSLCRFKRDAFRGGYESAASGSPRLSRRPLNARGRKPMGTTSWGWRRHGNKILISRSPI